MSKKISQIVMYATAAMGLFSCAPVLPSTTMDLASYLSLDDDKRYISEKEIESPEVQKMLQRGVIALNDTYFKTHPEDPNVQYWSKVKGLMEQGALLVAEITADGLLVGLDGYSVLVGLDGYFLSVDSKKKMIRSATKGAKNRIAFNARLAFITDGKVEPAELIPNFSHPCVDTKHPTIQDYAFQLGKVETLRGFGDITSRLEEMMGPVRYVAPVAAPAPAADVSAAAAPPAPLSTSAASTATSAPAPSKDSEDSVKLNHFDASNTDAPAAPATLTKKNSDGGSK